MWCLSLMYVLIFLVSSANRVAAYWGIAAHSAYDMFSLYKYLSVILVFPTPRFVQWEFLSDCAMS